uniref:hypothetical protein n=1 Tax=Polynucleobacter sp. TaxID=2029855 RepID=UPI004048040D
MNMFGRYSLRNIAYLASLVVLAVFVIIPVLTLRGDIWDGVQINYAVSTKNYIGLESWFIESTWYLQYPFVRSIIYLSEISGIEYKNINVIIVAIIFLFYLHEIIEFSRNCVGFTENDACVAAIIASTSPYWHVLLSSVMAFHIFCAWLGLISIRLIHTKTWAVKVFSAILLVIALNLQSQLVFTPILSYAYDVLTRQKTQGKSYAPSKITVSIFTVCVIYYLLINIVAPPAGIFENYQSMLISHPSGILPFILRGVYFTTYIIPLSFTVLVFVLLLSPTSRGPNNTTFTQPLLQHAHPYAVHCLSLLGLAAIFPYMAVGKASILWEFWNWNTRHMILLVFPLSILSVFTIRTLFVSWSMTTNRFIFRAIFILIGTLNLIFLSLSTLEKLNREYLLEKIEAAIISEDQAINPGVLKITLSPFPSYIFEFYEPNHLMYRATGRADWWTSFGIESDVNFEIPCFMRTNEKYQQQFIYNYLSNHELSVTNIKMSLINFSGLSNNIKNVLFDNKPGQVKVLSVGKIDVKRPLGGENCDK